LIFLFIYDLMIDYALIYLWLFYDYN